MKKILNLFIVFLILGSTQLAFADSINDKIISDTELSNLIIQAPLDPVENSINSYAKTNSIKSFSKQSRWVTGETFFLPRDMNYFNIYIYNAGTKPFTISIANNNRFIDSTVHIINPKKSLPIRVSQSKLYNLYRNSNGEPSHLVYLQVTSPGNLVKGDYRITYSK